MRGMKRSSRGTKQGCGDVSNEGTGQVEREDSMKSGVVAGEWSMEVSWPYLCSDDPKFMAQNCWTTPQFENQRTHGTLENTRTHFVKLLVAGHVKIYQPVVQVVRFVPSDKGPKVKTLRWTPSTTNIWSEVGRGECRLYHQITWFTWVWCYDGGHRLSE
jgi:hypothetical protein